MVWPPHIGGGSCPPHFDPFPVRRYAMLRYWGLSQMEPETSYAKSGYLGTRQPEGRVMTARTFARWVEPIAERLRRTRGEVVEFAHSITTDAWSRPSPLKDWTCNDILAHLAGGNDQTLQRFLRAVVAKEDVDASILTVDTDSVNVRAVLGLRERAVEELIAMLVEDSKEIQELLSRLGESDQYLRQDDLPMSLGDFLRAVHAENHDLIHLSQMRRALREQD